MRANLSEVYAEGNSMRQRLTLMGSAKDVPDRELPSNVELVQATCQELEARLEEECTQRSAAIAHAAQLMVQEAELTVEVASLKAAHLNTSSASATDISELEVEVASLRNQEKRLRDTESKAAKKIDDLSAEIAFLRCADGPLSRAEASEEKASDEAKELMAEVNSLRSLHEHAVQHGKSATLALRTLEKESAHSSQVSAASHTELLGQLHQYREMCSRLESAEAQLTWRLSSQEKNLSLEAKQAADYSAKCVAQASRVAKLEVLEEEEQMLAGRLEDRERLWSFELAGSNAAADAWRERCESQEASFAERYAVIQEAEKTCGALREAKEDAVRWRSRVQELHMERQHMESAIEALARARNSWHAKAEAAEHQMQNAVVATSSKAECMLQEKHLQSQAEIAAVRSHFSESQARALCDLQEAQEKVMVVEQEAVERARSEASEVDALQESLTEAKAKADALERISEDLKQEHATLQEKLTGLAEQDLEVAALRTSLSEANARSDALKRQTEDLKQDNVRLQERIVGLATESSEMQSKLQEQLLGQTQDASEVQVELVEKLTRQTEEADAMQSKLKQADRRFSASESGIEFLHTELSRTRRDSEQIWKALAVEQKGASGLRCRVRELETELEEHLGSMLTSRGPRGDSDFIVSMTPQPCVHKKLADDYRGCLSEPMPSLKDAMKLGALRQELRETKGGEPLSDMTGAWQRVQSLEARFSLVKDMKGVTQEEWINAAMTPDEYGNQPRISDTCKEIVLHSPMGSPAFTETCRSLKYGVPPSSLKDIGVTPMEPDPLAASVASSSSVATRLSGCLSPVDWLVGRHEALGSPQNCDVGLQHLGGRSPERSPASQARSQPLALTASPSDPRRVSRSSHPNGSPMPERRGSPMPDRRVSASPLPNSSPIPRLSCSPLPNGSPMPERRGLRC
jgi:chromosome segregation ATPase